MIPMKKRAKMRLQWIFVVLHKKVCIRCFNILIKMWVYASMPPLCIIWPQEVGLQHIPMYTLTLVCSPVYFAYKKISFFSCFHILSWFFHPCIRGPPVIYSSKHMVLGHFLLYTHSLHVPLDTTPSCFPPSTSAHHSCHINPCVFLHPPFSSFRSTCPHHLKFSTLLS